MDQQRRAERGEDRGRLAGPLGVVGGDPDIERFALAHGAVERPHRLLQRRRAVEPVAVEDVDVVESHPLQRLVERGEQVLARAAALPVGPRPHVPAGLGRDHHLVAVGREVLLHQAAEVDLGAAVGRPVVVGEVVVGDAGVEGGPRDRALRLERTVVTEVVPVAEREQRQVETGAAGAPVAHLAVVAVGIGGVGHVLLLSLSRRQYTRSSPTTRRRHRSGVGGPAPQARKTGPTTGQDILVTRSIDATGSVLLIFIPPPPLDSSESICQRARPLYWKSPFHQNLEETRSSGQKTTYDGSS